MKKMNEKVKASITSKASEEIELNKGEYVAWTYGDCDCVPFKTKKEATETRNKNFKSLYSWSELERFLPVHQEIFIESLGMEENIPVCTLEKRLKEQSAK